MTPRYRAAVEGFSWTCASSHRVAHSPTVMRARAGSIHSPRALLVSVLASHRSASTLRRKWRARSRPVGSRYRARHLPSGRRRTLPIRRALPTNVEPRQGRTEGDDQRGTPWARCPSAATDTESRSGLPGTPQRPGWTTDVPAVLCLLPSHAFLFAIERSRLVLGPHPMGDGGVGSGRVKARGQLPSPGPLCSLRSPPATVCPLGPVRGTR